MNGRMLFSAAVLVAALAAIGIVLGPDLFGGDDEDAKPAAEQRTTPTATEPEAVATTKVETTTDPIRPKQAALPENPDDLPGTDPRSLTRAANLRRALAVLERERTKREGVFDGLRVAPGRIDTTIDSARRKLTLQIRPDLKIAFRSDSEFPNDNDPKWREDGLGAGAVDVAIPQSMLRRIDRIRRGSAATDIDYFVIRRSIIDHSVGYGAYFNQGAQPRIVTREKNGSLRSIG